MPVELLRIPQDDALRALIQVVDDGYAVYTRVLNDHNRLDAHNVTDADVQRWKDLYAVWIRESAQQLLDVYIPQQYAQQFIHANPIEMSFPGRHQTCTNILGHIDLRVKKLVAWQEELKRYFHITFTVNAGRDANVQIGGEGNQITTDDEGR